MQRVNEMEKGGEKVISRRGRCRAGRSLTAESEEAERTVPGCQKCIRPRSSQL